MNFISKEPNLTKGLDAFLSISFGVIFYLLISQTRPDLFTLSTDGLSYFVPLISAAHNQWLNAEPLRVLWDLGEGWVPWESSQIGYLYPVYTFVQAIINYFQSPLYFIEISAAVHLSLMSFFAWLAPPIKLTRITRLLYSAAVLMLPGYLMIGTNWHNYLTPIPWYVLIVGLFLNAIVTGEAISFRRALGILLASAMCFSASHPQMYVLGVALLAITATFLSPRQSTLFNVGVLITLQIPFIPSLTYLYLLSIDATPIWASVRAQTSTITTSISLTNGLRGMLFGVGSPALFNPIFPILMAVALFQKRYLVAIGSILLIFLIFPSGLPGFLANVVDAALPGFRWPGKLVIFAGPLFIAVLVSLQTNRRVWWAIAGAALLMFVHNMINNDKATSLRSTHKAGIVGITEKTNFCLQQLSIQQGDRIAFVGDFKYMRSGSAIPLALHGVANNAALLFGLESHHLYEPLEPKGAAAEHQYLTSYWRRSLRPSELNTKLIDKLRHDGVDVLIAADSGALRMLNKNIMICTAGAYAVRIKTPPVIESTLFGLSADLVHKLDNGNILVNHSSNEPPNTHLWRVQQYPDGWERLGANEWRWNAPLPAFKWIALTLICWLFAVWIAWESPRIYEKLRLGYRR
jgi:hypothetical protein